MAAIARVTAPSDGLLPALIVGYRIAADAVLPSIDNAGRLWTCLEHQAGGYACTQHVIVGLVLRFGGNVERALESPEQFFRAFTLLRDDPWRGPLHLEFPDLACLHSAGARYSSNEVVALLDFVSRYFPVPTAAANGACEEAFIELECDAGEWVTGWRVWTCGEDEVGCVDHDNIVRMTHDETVPLAAEDLRRLQFDLYPSLGSTAPRGPRPRVYLLWENSD